jgi:hypothetical protein
MEDLMNRFRLLTAVALLVSAPALAYDGMDSDFSTCTQGKSTKAKIVQACSRLIDNAAAENATIGMIYGLRATYNDDPQQNCMDARKSLKLAETKALKDASQQLIDINC